MRQSPALTSWLLGQLVHEETVAGDLIEGYIGGRSRIWYWRQVAFAVVVEMLSEMREQKLLTLRAIVLGWCGLLPLVALVQFCQLRLIADGYDRGVWALGLSAYLASGWIVSWFHRRSMVFAFVASILLGSFLRYVELMPAWLHTARPSNLWRDVAGVLLGVFLRSVWSRHKDRHVSAITLQVAGS